MNDEVRRAKELSKYIILSKPNVVGVGYGYKNKAGKRTDELCVIALVQVKLPKSSLKQEELVPPTFDGVSTDVVQVGEIRALQSRTDRWRPAPGGVSIGHYQITAGTLGTMVRDATTGQRLILSNNHVLANSNDGKVGDPIYQPGPVDGGAPEDIVATLTRFVPIEFGAGLPPCPIAKRAADVANFVARLLSSSWRLTPVLENPAGVNLVDAAVATPLEDNDLSDDILDIGPVSGTMPAVLGMSVRKSGRTTALTTGTIEVVDAVVQVQYGAGKIATFEQQIISSAMSEGGDSGSLLVDGEGNAGVGLLFAGSTEVTIHNPIEDVLDLLEITL